MKKLIWGRKQTKEIRLPLDFKNGSLPIFLWLVMGFVRDLVFYRKRFLMLNFPQKINIIDSVRQGDIYSTSSSGSSEYVGVIFLCCPANCVKSIFERMINTTKNAVS